MERPGNVTIAVRLLYASIVLGILVTAILGFSPAALKMGLTFAIGVLAGTAALIAFFIYKISAGRNWARITFAVLFVLGLPSLFVLGVEPIRQAVLILQTLIQGYAMYLLFTAPGTHWFEKPKMDAEEPKPEQ